ncbi:hypothetical protein T492DRAFT_18390 [Pavlovales sp. CCMP2436]|nr:hypothetical protein T492DRAFT_18390 [Pavlovales sp. CCMP2436]
MYIGPWQEYVLGKALAQAQLTQLNSGAASRPTTAAGSFPDLPALHSSRASRSAPYISSVLGTP